VYVWCNGTIAGTLTLIAEYQKKSDYVVMPWFSYESFQKHPCFICEVIVIKEKESYYELRFREDDHDWSILIKRTMHPKHLEDGESYGFIKCIMKDGKIFSNSKITYEYLQQLISKKIKDGE
jgi:hypothetical protein